MEKQIKRNSIASHIISIQSPPGNWLVFLKKGLAFDYSLSSKERLLSCPMILLISV